MSDVPEEIDADPADETPPESPKVVTEVGEEYSLLPDGRIAIGFDGRRHVFRRPRFGEYKDLRVAFLELAAKEGDETIEFAVKYVEQTAAVLSDIPLPPNSDLWPTWLVAGMAFGDWLKHWRDVPLAHGGPTES